MKKYSFAFVAICICLLMPTKILAANSKSEIGTSVPTTHTIFFESEHATAEYLADMQKGISTAYPVSRFSEPSFKIQTDTCWSVKKVLLDQVDITSHMTTDGVIKLTKVSKDQTVTIICQENHTWGVWTFDGNGQHTRTCTQVGCGENETETCYGGIATCVECAVCQVCKECYGQIDGKSHVHVDHVKEKAATEMKEGNIEYWYCQDCKKYYADKEMTIEITLADTVTKKLHKIETEEETSANTGDSGMVLIWGMLCILSVMTMSVMFMHDKLTKYRK